MIAHDGPIFKSLPKIPRAPREPQSVPLQDIGAAGTCRSGLRAPQSQLGQGASTPEPTGAAARCKGGVGGFGTVAAGAGLAADGPGGPFLSKSSIYRIFKAYDLIPSPAFIVLSAAKSFRHPTRRPNEL